ncbi:enoyl-CoA hydratase-related protein [Streptomyces avicenniae]|uniref:enoyl-CoA hydratase-related protein n=1 Tax=Streptomyces avicenniae TaxID=500153 RepID=UPI00069B57AB|nr:enoyl-CoA hydratase-related protein [Streptomyces avicenniae]
MDDTVLREVTESLATITLNRPAQLNALNVAAKEALLAALREAAADSAVRAVLLTAGGRAFCVGQDLAEHRAALAGEAEPGDAMATVARHYGPIVREIAAMPKPVVAAVQGAAAGAGLGLALAADLRVAGLSASFHTAFAGIGLTADSGLSWTLPRAVGAGRAAELLLCPRRIGAEEAERLGLVQRVVPDDALAATARELARALAAGPTLAYAALKRSLAFGAAHTLDETLALEAELQREAGASADHRAAVEAFLRKGTPRFEGR